MVNQYNQKVIDIAAGSEDRGVVLADYAKDGGSNQNIVPVRCEGGYYLRSYDSELYVTVGESSLLSLEEFSGGEDQIFDLELVKKTDLAADGNIESVGQAKTSVTVRKLSDSGEALSLS